MLNVRRFAVVSLFSLCFPLAGVLAQESEVAPPADDETLANIKQTPPLEELRPNNEQVQANYALDVH